MASFNTYIDKIDLNLCREICQREGKLRHYDRGAYFLRVGETPKYFGFVESGCFKFTVADSSGKECITGFAPCNNLAGDFYSAVRHAPALYFARYNFVQNKKVSIFMLSRHKNDAYYKIYR